MQIETTLVNRPPKLMDHVRDRLRIKPYSLQTEKLYIQGVRRFILFSSKRHTKELGAKEVELFLTHLAVIGQVSASQN